MTAASIDAPRRTCSIEGCDRPSVSRGWCRRHYSQWHRYGDPLSPPRTPRRRAVLTVELERKLHQKLRRIQARATSLGNEIEALKHDRAAALRRERSQLGRIAAELASLATEIDGLNEEIAEEAVHGNDRWRPMP